MEKFLKLKEEINLHTLAEQVKDDRIIILRESQTTGTIQVKVLRKMSSRQIRAAFQPYTVEKIFDEFPADSNWDAVVIGAGPNGLMTAAYLAKAGAKVCVVERRYEVGGSLATEEILFPAIIPICMRSIT